MNYWLSYFGKLSNDEGFYDHGKSYCVGRGSGRTSVIFSQDGNNVIDEKKTEYWLQEWTVQHITPSVTSAKKGN